MANKGPRRVSKDDVRNIARESGGGKKYFKLPEGVSIWEPDKAQTFRIDFVPYVISTQTHPDRRGDKIVPGDLWWRYPFAEHANIGPSNETVVCPASFGKACPICEERAKLAKNYNDNEEAIKAIKAKKCCAYVIKDPADPDKYAVFAYSTFKFGDILDKELDEGSDTIRAFYDVTDEGKTVKIRFSDEEFTGPGGTGGKFLKATRIDFEDRPEMDEKEVLDAVPCLDDIFVVYEYEALKKLFLQISEGDSDGKSATGSTGSTSSTGAKTRSASASGPASGGKDKTGSNATAKASTTPTTPMAPKFKDDDLVTFKSKKDGTLSGKVTDVDGKKISIETPDGKEYDIQEEDVTLAGQAASNAKTGKGTKTTTPAPETSPEADPDAPKFKIGDTVKTDEDVVGTIKKIDKDNISIKTTDGASIVVDVDDIALYESEDAAETEDEDSNEWKEGDEVQFKDDTDIVVGVITKFVEKQLPTGETVVKVKVKDTDGTTHSVDAEDLLPAGTETTDESTSQEAESFDVGDTVNWDDGDEVGTITKLHSGGEKVKVKDDNGAEEWKLITDLKKGKPKKK